MKIIELKTILSHPPWPQLLLSHIYPCLLHVHVAAHAARQLACYLSHIELPTLVDMLSEFTAGLLYVVSLLYVVRTGKIYRHTHTHTHTRTYTYTRTCARIQTHNVMQTHMHWLDRPFHEDLWGRVARIKAKISWQTMIQKINTYTHTYVRTCCYLDIW